MGNTATVESEKSEDVVEPEELADELTIEDEQLEAAIKAADNEAKGAENTDEPGKVSAEPAAAATAEADDKPKQVPEGFVPVAVMTTLRKENVGLKQSNAHLVGQVQGLQMQGTNAQGQVIDETPAPKSFEDRQDELDQSFLEIARKVDDGDITNEDAERQRTDLRKQERTIQAEMNQPPEPAPAPVVAPATDLALEEHLSGLVKEYPILAELNERQLDPLKDLAYEQAEKEGDPIYKGALGTKNLRTRMAKLATQFYGTQEKPGSAGTAAAAKDTPGVDEAEIAKRDEKLKLAQTHPADVSQLGSATENELVSDEEALTRMDNMTVDEQIAYLDANPALKQRLEGL